MPFTSRGPNYAGRRVLITGGLGFIGSNLARALVRQGARVTIVDSLIPEYGGNRRNLHGIASKVTVNISDVRDRHAMPVFVKDQDVLFNLAGQTSHMDSMTDPDTDLEINARAQLSILEACRHHNPDLRIVFASTRQLYGKPQYLPVDEKHPLNPVDVNGINKLAGEHYHLLYHQVYGLKTSVLRLTNTIGPRMRIRDARQTFLGIWIRQALKGEPFEVWGGDQLRDFSYVDDAVSAFLLCGASSAADGRVFNVGGCAPIDLKDLADQLVALVPGSSYRQRRFPAARKAIDIGHYYADDSALRETLDWAPRTNLKTALQRTVSFFQRELAHYA
ncbi:NAD-dependent epimerase/dehydratase family protein [Actomonas aquatica]|uniref:NAD-dependent epimerase/dehydratase family protein n=1 Tax=Actomonas aquatica TaxID=2866162 RepID=A0ABZ1CAS0_9BACT|nr:NAD-dependent epimerase/dehydratase family protein [Opitutus sp. WL0086]WRQ88402.1 NAD-dependent epimerase/dehydratase family protein [Opitutus sp. WL0086]